MATTVLGSTGAGSAVSQQSQCVGRRSLQVRSILAERLAIPSEPAAAAAASRLSIQQNCASQNLGASQQRHSSSSGSGPTILNRGPLEPLPPLMVFGGDEEPHYRIAEEPIQGNYTGFVNYETVDGSILDDHEDDREIGAAPGRVVETPESFAKFLRHAPASVLKDMARACHLSNLAYVIRDLKKEELLQSDKLKLITSSIALQQEATSAAANCNGDNLPSQETMVLSPSTAYALAATASYLQSQRTNPSSNMLDQQLCSAVSSFMDSTETACSTSVAASPADELNSSRNQGDESTSTSTSSTSAVSPACEWFVCDDETSFTRTFAIQGSESMASWKANLAFQPTEFENSGVMVHKGVYEVAKGLYNQMLPLVRSHMNACHHGNSKNVHRISFTGHSLGGSLAVLLSLMFRCRGEVPVSALERVYTFGAPCVMNGGDGLLQRLGFLPTHVQSVVLSRDLVPRIFSCDIPEKIVEVLTRVNQNFKNVPSFANQRELYNSIGQLLILQPEAQQAPGHPLLPSGSGLYMLEQPGNNITTISSQQESHYNIKTKQVQSAEKSFLNTPHPLEIISDPTSFSSTGAICRDHDPRSYRRAVNHVLKQTVQSLPRRKAMELKHLEASKRSQGIVVWPSSPVDTPRRGNRSMADASLISSANFGQGYFRVPGAATSGVCNYLSQGLRRSLESAPGQNRLGSSTACRSHVLSSHSQGCNGRRYGSSVVVKQY